MILVEGISVNATDNAGWTPLHEAVHKQNLEVVELLLKYGAEINAVGQEGTR